MGSDAGDIDVAGLNSKFILRKRDTRKESVFFQQSYYCFLYKKTGKERRKRNPPTPNILSLDIHFIDHHEIILYALIYDLSLHPGSYTPFVHFLSEHPPCVIQPCNTSLYVLISFLSLFIVPTPSQLPYIPLEPSSPYSLDEWLHLSGFLLISPCILLHVTYCMPILPSDITYCPRGSLINMLRGYLDTLYWY